MPDEPELCCAAGICCDKDKRRVALAKILRARVPSLSEANALHLADVVHDEFDLLPKVLGFSVPLRKLEQMAREHPYL
jgi:hypothetical protein